MQTVVYVDVLVCVNLIVDFFLLMGTAKFLVLPIKKKKILLGALLGGAYSLIIFVPNFNMAMSIICSLLAALLIIFVSFGFYNLKSFIKKIATFYAFSLLFTGSIFLLQSIFKSQNSLINNGIVYINISPIILIIFTGISYILIRLFQRLIGRNNIEKEYYKAKIEVKGKTCNILGKVDTGLNLTEPFSNLPVIVVDPLMLKPMLEIDKCMFDKANELKFRVIPFHAMGKEGTLKAFKPDNIVIYKGNESLEKEAYIAICEKGELNGEFNALINPLIVE